MQKINIPDTVLSLLSDRHKKSLEYAISIIESSSLFHFCDKLYLFGSCAKNNASWESDIDLFLVLKDDIKNYPKLKREIIYLKSNVTTDDFHDPESDLKIAIGKEWETDSSLFYENIRKDGILLWP